MDLSKDINFVLYFRLLGSLSDIYYGRVSHHWAVDIDATLREDEEETSDDEGLHRFSSM